MFLKKKSIKVMNIVIRKSVLLASTAHLGIGDQPRPNLYEFEQNNESSKYN